MEILPENEVMWVDAGDVDAMVSALTALFQSGKRKPVVYDLGDYHIERQVTKIHAFYQQVLSASHANQEN